MFGTVLADPAWEFSDKKSGMIKTGKGASSHYQCLPLSKILTFLDDTRLPNTDLPISECIANNAHLWLWVPNAFVIEGVGAQVARAWGFEPKTLVTWAKGRLTIDYLPDSEPPLPFAKIIHQIGQGSWIRNSTEQLIFCVSGKAPPAVRNLPSMHLSPDETETVLPDEYLLEPRTQHSRKPDTIHRWAERLSPGPRLELFARREQPGWVTLGHEVSGSGKTAP